MMGKLQSGIRIFAIMSDAASSFDFPSMVESLSLPVYSILYPSTYDDNKNP